MSKKLPTVWSIEPHTQKKHEILRNYVNAWFPIMSKFHMKLVYIDGFAGPGKYSGGEDGSPIVVLKAARDHQYPIGSDLTFIFVEKDKKRSRELKNAIASLDPSLPANFQVEVVSGTFDEHLTTIFSKLDDQKSATAPTLAFIDPFGFAQTPFSTVKRVLENSKGEVLINFMYEEVNRFISHPRHSIDYDLLFGTTAWRDAGRIAGPVERKRAFTAFIETSYKHVRNMSTPLKCVIVATARIISSSLQRTVSRDSRK